MGHQRIETKLIALCPKICKKDSKKVLNRRIVPIRPFVRLFLTHLQFGFLSDRGCQNVKVKDFFNVTIRNKKTEKCPDLVNQYALKVSLIEFFRILVKWKFSDTEMHFLKKSVCRIMQKKILTLHVCSVLQILHKSLWKCPNFVIIVKKRVRIFASFLTKEY